MHTLKSLGMKRNWLYEIVVTSYDGHVTHAAPFGVKTIDFKKVNIEMFKGSNTLKNVLVAKEFTLNAVDDPVIFYNALYCKEQLHFDPAPMIKAPILRHSFAYIEAKLQTATENERSYLLEAEVVHVHIRKKGVLTNRAQALVLESLILSTRRFFIPEEELKKMLNENYRVIKKVAPGSTYEMTMHKLFNDCFGNGFKTSDHHG